LELLKAVILGLVQGLSEFLPVSSSGHLVLAAEILNFNQEGIAFEVFVHFGTLLAVLIAFNEEIIRMILAPYRVWIKKSTNNEDHEFLRWDLYVILGSIPAALVGFLLKDQIESLFSDPLAVIVFLGLTGCIMFVSQFLKKTSTTLNLPRSFLIGIAQACAILPGISRSGITIVTGMALKINREKVAKFSFILSIPAILGATILQVSDLIHHPPSSSELINLITGALIAFGSGYFAILWLMDIVKKGKLEWFGYYCFLISFIGLIWYIS